MEKTQASEGQSKSLADREGKYLTFTLAEEEYGIGILKIGWTLTKVQLTESIPIV